MVNVVQRSQFLAIDAGSPSTCTCWISTLNHKVLETSHEPSLQEANRWTYSNDSVEDNSVVIPSVGQLSKVLAGLPFRQFWHGSPIVSQAEPYLWGMVPIELELDISQACLEHDRVHCE
jgi:hypothetical protein